MPSEGFVNKNTIISIYIHLARRPRQAENILTITSLRLATLGLSLFIFRLAYFRDRLSDQNSMQIGFENYTYSY
jgi:hypothetical protein